MKTNMERKKEEGLKLKLTWIPQPGETEPYWVPQPEEDDHIVIRWRPPKPLPSVAMMEYLLKRHQSNTGVVEVYEDKQVRSQQDEG